MNFRSSHIKDISHDGDLMTVEFHNGKSYRYPKTPKTLYDAFLQAPSKGRFFHRFVNRYKDGELVEKEEKNDLRRGD